MENEVFSIKFNTFISFKDDKGYLRPFGYADLFQQAGSLHAKELKVSYNYLIKENKIWVIVQNKVKIVKNCKDLEECIVETWPVFISKLKTRREYVLKDLSGNIIALGTSLWCTLDCRTMMPTFLPVSFKDSCFYDKYAIDEDYTKLENKETKDMQFSYSVDIKKSFYDKDKHVNNAKYLDFIYDALSLDDKYISNYTIDYVSQCFVGDIIDIYLKEDQNNHFYVYGYNHLNNKIVFKSYIKLDNSVI